MLKALCTDSRTHRKSAEKSGQDAEQASVSCLENGLQNGAARRASRLEKPVERKRPDRIMNGNRAGIILENQSVRPLAASAPGLRRKAQQKQTQDRKGSEKEKEKQLSAH